MSLERAYRRLLLAYPRRWWDARGEEVLAVLLDGAQARGARRPSASEGADLVLHGLLARAGHLGRAVVAELDGRARELVATLALASLTAMSLLCLLVGEWWPWTGVGGGLEEPLSSFPGTPGPIWTAGGPLMAALLLPALLVVLGRTRSARNALLALVPAVLATPAVAAGLGVHRPAVWSLAGLVLFAVMSLAAPVRRRWLLAALTLAIAGLVAFAVCSGLGAGVDPRPGFYYGEVLQPLALSVPVGVLLAVAVAGAFRAVVPACLVGAAWLVTFAGRLVSSAGDTTGAVLYLTGAASLVLVSLAAGAYRQSMDDRLPTAG